MHSTSKKRRRYGQHFLTDSKIIRRIIDVSGIGADDAVLEIGPGRGDLTRALAARAKKVLAVEVDRRLFAELAGAGVPANVEARLGDVLELSGEDIIGVLGAGYHLVANLPYEITTAALRKFLKDVSPRPRTMTLMLQREVGERITAGPGGMNRLALFCGYAADVRLLFCVPAGAFSPPPDVQSCVVHFRLRPEPLLPPPAEERFFRLIEAAFASKRKQLKTSLRPLLGPDAEKRLSEAGLNPQARPEETSLKSWLLLASKM